MVKTVIQLRPGTRLSEETVKPNQVEIGGKPIL